MSRFLTIMATVLLASSLTWNVYALSSLPEGWTTTENLFAICSACPALVAVLFFFLGSCTPVREWIKERPRLALLVAFAFGHVLWPHKANWPFLPDNKPKVVKVKPCSRCSGSGREPEFILIIEDGGKK